jgi:hypothetical protein
MKTLKEILVEKEEVDIQFRQEAESFYNDLISYLKSKKDKDMKPVDQGYFKQSFVLPAHAINKKYEDLILVFASSTRFTNFKAAFGRDSGKGWMVLPVLKKGGTYDAGVLPGLQKSKSTIIHEFIHYLDSMRYKGDYEKATTSMAKGPPNSKDYYNNPQEYNAYYQQAVSEFADAVDRARKAGHTHRLQYYLPNNVNDFVKNFKTGFIRPELLHNLNPKLMRNLDKRVADLYVYLKSQVKQ